MTTDVEIERKITETLGSSKWVLFTAASITVVSLVIDIYVPQESAYFWFQRSGSIVVLLSVWSEYKLLKVHGDINPPPSSYVSEDKWKQKFGFEYKVVSRSTLIAVILGTIIWGYGDIPFKNS